MTLSKLLANAAARHPERTATIETVGSKTIETTYSGIAEEVQKATGRLRAHGLTRGDTLAFWAENRREFFVWHLAAADAGLNLVGLNTRYRVQELIHVLDQARVELVIMPLSLLDLDLDSLLTEAAARLKAAGSDWPVPQVAVLPPTGEVSVGEPPPQFDIGAGAWWADEPIPAVNLEAAGIGADLAMTFTTSGSTGMPKLAAHDQQAVFKHARAVADSIALRPGDVVACALPLTGVFSYIPAMAAISAGASLLLVPVFSGPQLITQMHQHHVTHIFGGDDLFVGLEKAWRENPIRLSQWRLAGIASFVGRVEQLVPWLEACSPARMCGVYGSSEVFSLLSIRDHDSPTEVRHVGGGRLVSADLEVRAIDPADRSVLPPGITGHLEFRGYNVVQKYLRHGTGADPDTDDGWFDSGDLGSVDANGRTFTYEGRAGDALRLRGFLVQPTEIEMFLLQGPDIDMAKVVGTEHDGRDVAVAFVTARPGHTLDVGALRAWCTSELAPFKVPAHIVVLDDMPVTSGTNGSKIKAAELRSLAAEL